MQRTKLSDQIKQRASAPVPDDESGAAMISTGSTLLDLAISGARTERGGIPAGVLVEIFGPASSGKTVMLSEIAGSARRAGGQVMFRDPEARLNREFAALFGLDIDEVDYDIPSTVAEVFGPIREWEPEPQDAVHGVFADSLAALTTEWEEEGKDQYGMRRAKEFSEQCRLTCRSLPEKNIVMVCSNQVRQNLDAGPYGQKYKSPGGEAIGFYASLRLRIKSTQKIQRKRKVKGQDLQRIVGVQTEIEVFKSSISEPYHTAPIYILYDYGIDDIRANLQFVKSIRKTSKYVIGDQELDKSLEKTIEAIEEDELEHDLENEVVDLWHEIEKNFRHKRKAKRKDD